MAKRKSYSKKSISRLPKGLPIRNNSHGATKGTTSTQSTTNGSANPFEITQRMKRPKFAVHNRGSAATTSQQQPQRMSALAEALSKRQTAIVTAIQQQKKANIFTDQRIGESNNNPKNEEMMMLSNDAKNLARLVRERARQSKRISKYSLQGDLDNDAHQLLTHKGRAITDMADVDHVMLSDDDEEEDGNLDAYDTAMHFGGKGISDPKFNSTYGNTDSAGTNLSNAYSQKKQDLDDMIMRRKVMKLERLKSRELQVDKFEAMDQSFAELASVLQFRDKEQEIRQKIQLKRTGGELSPEDQEHDDWEREMKQYLYVERKVAATDRTKTPEEIAKEEAEKLHQLETRRLARMNGDIGDDDDLSDIDSNHPKQSKRRKVQQQGKIKYNNAEALDNDSDVEQDNNERTTRFTSEGLVYVNKEGVVIGKVEDVDNNDSDDESVSINDQSEGDDESVADSTVFNVGDKVTANYRATEQYDGHKAWYSGTITAVVVDDNNVKTYNIEYDDGDFEDAVEPRHIKPAELSTDEVQSNNTQNDQEVILKRKRRKAIEQARSEIPYVLEVPTTLDALHGMISNYATTGNDVSLIIQRIHTANSVRLDRRNSEKMQNFHDVLLRRFVAVGDAIYTSGNGGTELNRYKQLDSLTQTLYAMAQEAPDTAGAVWNRRLGLFQSSHTKRLRDAGMGHVDKRAATEDEERAWPSSGVILLLRGLGHIFPVTDKRHHVVTPTLLFLGQMLGHTPIVSMRDLVMSTLCCGLFIEYTKGAKRIAPEAHAFLASVIRLFAHDASDRHGTYPLPTFQAASQLDTFSTLRGEVCNVENDGDEASPPQLSFEALVIGSTNMPAAILYSALHMIEVSIQNLSGSIASTETEVFAEIVNSFLFLQPQDGKVLKNNQLPQILKAKVSHVASILSSCMSINGLQHRVPLQRRVGTTRETAILTLAPRMENPDRYNITQKDRHKTATQAAADRTRREYKREHKAVSRELRLDSTMVEVERRRIQDKKDAAAKAKRQRAFAWMEGEQAAMNQQVRQGGGLLQGGGMGAAKAKAASGKFGIKKGGKLR